MFTLEQILATEPCWTKSEVLAHWPEGAEGVTARQIAEAEFDSDSESPVEDKIWILIALLPEEDQRRFVCLCVRRVWHLLEDERSRSAVEAAERYIEGEATREELDAAWVHTWDAASAAPRSASRAASWAAARAVTFVRFSLRDRDIAWAAARDAVEAAARDQAEASARPGPWSPSVKAGAQEAQIGDLVALHGKAAARAVTPSINREEKEA